MSWHTEKWCQISFLYEQKYRRYVQGNFLMGLTFSKFFLFFFILFIFILFYLFFCVCRVFSCSALRNVSFSTACHLALDGTYIFFNFLLCRGPRAAPRHYLIFQNMHDFYCDIYFHYLFFMYYEFWAGESWGPKPVSNYFYITFMLNISKYAWFLLWYLFSLLVFHVLWILSRRILRTKTRFQLFLHNFYA